MPSVNTPTETTRMPSTGTGNTSDRSEKVMARRKEDGEVGPYVLGSELGKGSFAVVYKGYHEVCIRISSSRTAINCYVPISLS